MKLNNADCWSYSKTNSLRSIWFLYHKTDETELIEILKTANRFFNHFYVNYYCYYYYY